MRSDHALMALLMYQIKEFPVCAMCAGEPNEMSTGVLRPEEIKLPDEYETSPDEEVVSETLGVLCMSLHPVCCWKEKELDILDVCWGSSVWEKRRDREKNMWTS